VALGPSCPPVVSVVEVKCLADGKRDMARDFFDSWPLLGGAAQVGYMEDVGEEKESRVVALPPKGILEIERWRRKEGRLFVRGEVTVSVRLAW